jgi:DNA-binding LacI/PurR family transcriptional regulator
VGVILPDITKMFFPDVLKGIMTGAADAGYKINILSSNFNFETERSHVDYFKGSRVDGIILDSCVDRTYAREWAHELTRSSIETTPIVSLESMLDEKLVSSVLIDCERRSFEVTQHLIDIGCKHIFYIYGPLNLAHGYARFNGYKQALKANNIEIDEALTAGGEFLSKTAYEAVVNALKDGLKFDAVQAVNDQAAIGALKALKEAGVKVPEDVAVCGFDNLFPSTLVSPQITTVNIPRYSMGLTAFEELLRRMQDKKKAPKCHVLDSFIVIRSSTRSEMVGDWNLDNW